MQRSGPSTGQGLGTQLQGFSLRLWRGFEKPSLGPSPGKAVHPKTHPQRQWRVLIRLFGLLSPAPHTLSLFLRSRKGTMVYINTHPVRGCVGSSPKKCSSQLLRRCWRGSPNATLPHSPPRYLAFPRLTPLGRGPMGLGRLRNKEGVYCNRGSLETAVMAQSLEQAGWGRIGR